MSMNITVVEVDDKKIWDSAKVRNKITQQVRTVKVLPEDKTISQCFQEGLFTSENIDYETLMLNKHRFELINED